MVWILRLLLSFFFVFQASSFPESFPLISSSPYSGPSVFFFFGYSYPQYTRRRVFCRYNQTFSNHGLRSSSIQWGRHEIKVNPPNVLIYLYLYRIQERTDPLKKYYKSIIKKGQIPQTPCCEILNWVAWVILLSLYRYHVNNGICIILRWHSNKK